MAGNLAFHREEHRAALDKFATARRIYSDLSQVGTPSQRELFATFSEELQPFIRFCEHRLALQGRRQGVEVSSALDLSSSGDSASNALLQSKIDVVLLEARKQKVANLGSVEWKGKQIAIPSQELGMALLGPDEVAAKLEALPVVSAGESDKKRDVLFLSLLSAYDSVLQLIKTDPRAAARLFTRTLRCSRCSKSMCASRSLRSRSSAQSACTRSSASSRRPRAS
jgi:hypothetical protein